MWIWIVALSFFWVYILYLQMLVLDWTFHYEQFFNLPLGLRLGFQFELIEEFFRLLMTHGQDLFVLIPEEFIGRIYHRPLRELSGFFDIFLFMYFIFLFLPSSWLRSNKNSIKGNTSSNGNAESDERPEIIGASLFIFVKICSIFLVCVYFFPVFLEGPVSRWFYDVFKLRVLELLSVLVPFVFMIFLVNLDFLIKK